MKLSHTYKREPGSGIWRPLFCFKRPLLTIRELMQRSVEAGAPHRVKSAKLWQKSLTINPSLVCNRFGSSCKVAKPLQRHLNSFSPMDQHDKVGNSNIQTTLSPKQIEVRFYRHCLAYLVFIHFILFSFCRVPCFSSFLVSSQFLLSTNQKRQVVNKNIVKK